MRLKILYVAANLHYTNPTGHLLPAVLDQVGEVVFFGPGFVSTTTLAAGLDRFIDAHGPFDFAVTTEMVAITVGRLSLDWLTHRITRLYFYDFPLTDFGYLPQIASDWRALKIPRLVSLLQDDLYNWTARHVDLALASSEVILGNGLENVVKVSEMRDADSEPWAARATDVFVDFLAGAPERFASFPLFISDSEICRTSHFARKRRWAVPGVQYRARRMAAEHLMQAGHRIRRTAPSLYVHKAAEFFGKMSHGGVSLAQYFFRRELETSKAAYTCGSVLRQPIRKFFEIPAAGALMVCEPCAGLGDYGFVHDISCLMLPPDTVLEADRMLIEAPETAQVIARNGQRVVIEKHTIPARARQLATVLQKMQQGTFAGARWKEGEYVLAEPSKNASVA